jgi:hypothetical protein
MCPLCLSLAGWIAVGCVSSAGLGLLAAPNRTRGEIDDDASNRKP